MGMLMITCPTTKKPVPTGIAMDKESFKTATLTNNSVSCAACGKMHTWSKKDAYVAG
jgi:endogenous inhibitor of DNA gyrase (YacG/DUF329 family)